MSHEFIGWVPCVSGKLYFEFTSCDVINENGYLNTNHIELDKVSNTEKRYFIVASEVDWEDVKTANSEGIWNVILIGSSPLNSIEIEGKVILIPSSNNIWREKIIPLFQDVSQLVKEKEDIYQKHSDIEQLLVNLINSGGTFGSSFILKNNGITYLSPLNNINEDEKMLICRQCYYFVKYTFHKDKHHARSETLTTCHRITNLSEIGLTLVSDLKKALVTLKRDCDAADYKSLFAAKGILSYAKSLLMTCKAEGLMSSELYTIEKAYIDNIGESLDVMGKRVEGELVAKTSYDTNCRSIGLFIFAAIAPFTLVYKDQIASHISKSPAQENHIVKLLQWFLGSEKNVLMAFLVVLGVYFIFQNIYLRYGSPSFAARKLKRISITYLDFVVDNRRSAEVLYIVTKLALLIFTICFVFSYFNI